MDFQRARTEKQVASRQEEIIAVCDAIYRESGYDAVHFKAVSRMTSISRPTIYNYYNTKEEIFLDILRQDYEKWTSELKDHYETTPQMTKEEYCTFLADTLVRHEKYLELLTVYLNPIEQNSSLEKLCTFKAGTRPYFEALRRGLDQYFPKMTEKQKDKFIFYFMITVDGVYPLTHLSEKQLQAVKTITPEHEMPDFHKACYDAFLMLLSAV